MKRLALLCLAAAFSIAAHAHAQTCPVAQMTSPANGSTLPVGAVTFTWCDANADYFLTVEDVFGSHDIFNGLVPATTVTLGPYCATTLPLQCIPARGETIYVTLWTKIKGVYQTPFQYTYTAGHSFHTSSLVSDALGTAPVADPHLVNAWGLAHTKTSPWWVSNNGTGTSTVYDGTGNPYPAGTPLVVTVPAAGGPGTGTPSGIVALGSKFVFVTLDGTISQWSSGTKAAIKVSSPGHSYTGCTVAAMNGATTIYVAGSQGIEAYDTAFHPVTLAAGAFTDPLIPAGYIPYNIQSAGGKLYVTFANGLPGAGQGYVDAFDTSGTLLKSMQHGNWMNAPWGVALAPAVFGSFGHALLVGQLGSGNVAAFNPSTGKFLGMLRDFTGTPITIAGLWGVGFGNDGSAGPSTTLYFTSGPGSYLHGLFGTILPD